MTTDFEAKAVMCALLLRFTKKNQEVVGSSFNQPKIAKRQIHKTERIPKIFSTSIINFSLSEES